MIKANFPKHIILPARDTKKDLIYVPNKMTVKNITEVFINKHYLHRGTFDMTNVTVIDKDENKIKN